MVSLYFPRKVPLNPGMRLILILFALALAPLPAASLAAPGDAQLALASDNPMAVSGPSPDLALYALSLNGTAYKYGGRDPESGLDCSGFVGHVFREVTGVTLPHNAQAISQVGKKIGIEELKPGDLVFFNTLRRAFSHVGIYLGNNQFIHASSSRTGDVMVSNMSESYWAKRFNGARRLDVADR
jgi:cell wall-associated NlpC family hydrolase